MDTPLSALSLLFPPGQKHLVTYMPLSFSESMYIQFLNPTRKAAEVEQRAESNRPEVFGDEPSSTFAWATCLQYASLYKEKWSQYFTQYFNIHESICHAVWLRSYDNIFETDFHGLLRKARTRSQTPHAWQTIQLPLNSPWQVFLYSAGFPCTPFSMLHWQSLLLQEAAARPMYRVVDNIKACQPAATQQKNR